ncbi:MAG: hypothetical protein ACRDHW_19465, partial [Ktedonobacteraceae bacterium]
LVQWVVMLSGSFALYVLIERPGMHLSTRLRQRMMAHEKQKGADCPTQTAAQDEMCADEQTQPHQTAILSETPRS